MSEELETPQSRTEEILQNALGGSYDVEPQSRVETLLTKVIDSGGGAFVVNFNCELDEHDQYIISDCDKTFSEVADAIQNGIFPTAIGWITDEIGFGLVLGEVSLNSEYEDPRISFIVTAGILSDGVLSGVASYRFSMYPENNYLDYSVYNFPA